MILLPLASLSSSTGVAGDRDTDRNVVMNCLRGSKQCRLLAATFSLPSQSDTTLRERRCAGLPSRVTRITQVRMIVVAKDFWSEQKQSAREYPHSIQLQDGHGWIATLITPPFRSPNSLYASVIWSRGNVCVSSGRSSSRPCRTSSMSRRIRSLPPGQSVVTIL